jgi:hypothetical protein
MLEFVYQLGFFIERESRQKHRIDHNGRERQKTLDPERNLGDGLVPGRLGRGSFIDGRLDGDFWHDEIHRNFPDLKVFMALIVRRKMLWYSY